MMLPDLRDGKWVHSKDGPYDAGIGYFDYTIKVKKDFSPIVWKSNASIVDRNFTPTGEFTEQDNMRMNSSRNGCGLICHCHCCC